MEDNVVAKCDFIIKSSDIQTAKGYKARKDYNVRKGDKFSVVTRSQCPVADMIGATTLVLEDPRRNGYRLFAEERFFDRVQN